MNKDWLADPYCPGCQQKSPWHLVLRSSRYNTRDSHSCQGPPPETSTGIRVALDMYEHLKATCDGEVSAARETTFLAVLQEAQESEENQISASQANPIIASILLGKES